MNGILINYEYCTGCHSCEVACKKRLGLPEGEFGIKLTETGPWEYAGEPKGEGRWEWTWLPVLTKACDLCADRTEKGHKMPMCVQHCQAWCLYHGEVGELARKMDGKTRWALMVPHMVETPPAGPAVWGMLGRPRWTYRIRLRRAGEGGKRMRAHSDH